MTRESAIRLFEYLCKLHTGFGERANPQIRDLWTKAFEAVPTYDMGFDAVNTMLHRVDWPGLPAFHTALTLTPRPAPTAQGEPSPAELAEAIAMKRAWKALDPAVRDQYETATKQEWKRSGWMSPAMQIVVRGHARRTWWDAEGRRAWQEGDHG